MAYDATVTEIMGRDMSMTILQAVCNICSFPFVFATENRFGWDIERGLEDGDDVPVAPESWMILGHACGHNESEDY